MFFFISCWEITRKYPTILSPNFFSHASILSDGLLIHKNIVLIITLLLFNYLLINQPPISTYYKNLTGQFYFIVTQTHVFLRVCHCVCVIFTYVLKHPYAIIGKINVSIELVRNSCSDSRFRLHNLGNSWTPNIL